LAKPNEQSSAHFFQQVFLPACFKLISAHHFDTKMLLLVGGQTMGETIIKVEGLAKLLVSARRKLKPCTAKH
jgi:hypothetical protein